MSHRRYALARRIGLIAALALTGYAAVTNAVGASLAVVDPDAALTVSADNVRALGERAKLTIAEGGNDQSKAEAVAMARRAVTLDATAVPAIVALGLYAGTSGQPERAGRIMTYAEALSRRDAATQLYFIEDTVARGDFVAALRHYDTMLRTSDSAPTLLLPILRNAIAEPQLRHALAITLLKRPAWAERFVNESSAFGPDFHAVALLFVELKRGGYVPPVNANNGLIVNLLAKNDLQTAWRYYTIIHPGADAAKVRDPAFAGAPAGTPFDWILGTDDGISTSMGVDDQSGGLDFSTTPTNSGVVVRQLLVLPPGTYRLGTVVAGITQDQGDGPYWELACLNGKVAGTLETKPTGDKKVAFYQNVTVPVGCEGQWFQLRVRPSDDVKGTTGQVFKASVDPVR